MPLLHVPFPSGNNATIRTLPNIVEEQSNCIRDAIYTSLYTQLNENAFNIFLRNIEFNTHQASGCYIKIYRKDENIRYVMSVHSTQQNIHNRLHFKIEYGELIFNHSTRKTNLIWKIIPNSKIKFSVNDAYEFSIVDQGYINEPKNNLHKIFIISFISALNICMDPTSRQTLENIPEVSEENNKNTIIAGGNKKKKNNFKKYSILELKNICRNNKIKNYSKLNKDGLITLIKKHKIYNR